MWYELMNKADSIVETSMIPTMLMLVLSWVFAFAIGRAYSPHNLEWSRKKMLNMIKNVCQSSMNNSGKLECIWQLLTRRMK